MTSHPVHSGAPFSTDPEEAEQSGPSTEMQEIYERSVRDIVEGEIVKGTILGIKDDSDVVDVFLEQKEDSEGVIVLSREKAAKIKIWDELSRVYEKGGPVNGTILGRTKGGLIVDIGVRAFLPGSQVDLRPVRELDKLIGKAFPMKIIKLNQKRGNIVLSRRELLEEERKHLKEATLAG